MDNWIKVYKSGNFIEAEMVKDMLVENDVEAVVVNKIDSSLNFGEASVLCTASKEQEALALIQSNLSANNE
jgi:hypothetical protein